MAYKFNPFTGKLEEYGPILTGTGTVSAAADGTAALPGISFANDLSVGIYRPGAEQLAFSTNGTGRLFVDASGNIGIRTGSPFSYGVTAANLANVQIEAPQYGVLTLGSTGGATGQKYWRMISRGNMLQIQSMNDAGSAESTAIQINKGTAEDVSNIQLFAGGNIRATITGTGAVSGASATPTSLTLDNTYKSGSASWDALKINLYKSATEAYGFGVGAGADLHYFAGDANSGVHVFYTSRTERARIDSSGRLLVGTSSTRSNDGVTPRFLLEGAQSIQALGVCCNESSTPSAGAYVFLSRSRGSAVGTSTVVSNGDTLGGINFYGADGTDIETAAAYIQCAVDGTPVANDMPGRLVFSTTADGASSPGEAMRISSGKNVLLSGCASDTLNVTNTSGAGTTNTFIVGRYSNSAGTTGGTISLLVYTNGNVQNTNNSYGAISDIKLKENIVDASSQWDDLKALQVRNYNFKEGQTHTQIGLIAQEVELVSPGLVSESPDRDADGNDLGTVTKSVNYSVLYMKAVKALQEAMERIEQLETEMAAVKAQLS